jgi:hypothetical protein
VTGLVLALGWFAAASEATGDPPYTADETRACSNKAAALKRATEGGARPEAVEIYRRLLVSCVSASRAETAISDARATSAAAKEANAPEPAEQSTPAELQFGWSARICDRQGERAESIAAIRKEHRYSKIGGVVHLGRLGELQDEVASADEDIAEYRSELRKLRRPALSCRYVTAHRE